jgi:hypothetical protein
MVELNDAIYEIYGSCEEFQQGLANSLNRSSYVSLDSFCLET